MADITYRYDLHVHTTEGSACAHNSAAEMAEMYARAGYTGFVVTDHFYRGNTSVPRDLPWEEWVERFHLSWVHASERGKELGLDVFWGWEFSYSGIDFLTYGLGTEWLLAHPEVREIGLTEYLDLVHQSGGFVTHAHPFAEAGYIPYIRLLPHHVDAVEVINAERADIVNARALAYADSYGLIHSGGSDSHTNHWGKLGGVEVDHRLTSVEDLIETLRQRKHTVFRIPGV